MTETIETKPASLQEKLTTLPTSPGVYQFRNRAGKVIYVGKAKNLRNRVHSYFRDPRQLSGKTLVLAGHIADVEVIITSSEVEALILENNLIKELKPRYNVNLKDDKTYPYLVITSEPFPRIFITRHLKRDGSTWFGPYTEAGQLRSILDLIGSIFPLRSCRFRLTEETVGSGKYKVCLDYHIHKCKGPCEGLQSEGEYGEMIDEIVRLLKGRTTGLVCSLTEKMHAHAAALRFEAAAEIRSQIDSLKRYGERQKVVSLDGADRDVLAVAAGDDDACAVVFTIREGKLLGSRRICMNNTGGESEAALLSKAAENYYLGTVDPMPDEILLQHGISDDEEEGLKALVDEKKQKEHGRKSSVRIIVPRIGEKAHLLDMCGSNARHHLEEYLIQKQKRGEAARETPGPRELMKLLHLPKLPERIECFDNSHLQGTDYVSSMVTFVHGKPKKSDYRKFRLRSFEGSDDYAAMEEVITRRYTGSLAAELPMPDLIVVDGGKGQVNSAHAVLSAAGLNMPVIGLAKRLEEVFMPHVSDPFNLPKTSPALKLLQQLRDEAHRFAVTYHRKLRTERTLQTELTSIAGIGETTAEKLLRHFGSVDRIAALSLEELDAAAGKNRAEKIFRFYHPEEERE
ncbi:MAG: excinuclease ABC subunit C [Chlorobi bacterium]|nr:excinuclease ABC subunit C [Chlorobiota bacterium]